MTGNQITEDLSVSPRSVTIFHNRVANHLPLDVTAPNAEFIAVASVDGCFHDLLSKMYYIFKDQLI